MPRRIRPALSNDIAYHGGRPSSAHSLSNVLTGGDVRIDSVHVGSPVDRHDQGELVYVVTTHPRRSWSGRDR
jgi:hypothetical protein